MRREYVVVVVVVVVGEIHSQGKENAAEVGMLFVLSGHYYDAFYN
jgi:hypothetical protein